MTTPSGSGFRYFAFLGAIGAVISAAFVACSLYERSVLGEYSLGIGKPPLVTPYYFGRLLLLLLLSALVVGGLYRLRGTASAIEHPALTPPKYAAACGMLLFAVAATMLFAFNPVLFYEIAVEDSVLEWTSALLPLASSAAFAYAFWRVLRSERHHGRRHALVLTFLFAVALFVIGMEEISWMQRVFGIETPDAFSRNQQQEMNLHNMHSIGVGTAHLMAMVVGLIVLPFVVETAPAIRLPGWIVDFLPSRFVLALSAPFAAFNYNAWNLFLTPLIPFVAVAIAAVYARAARRRGDHEEMTLFALIGVFVVLGQTLFLVLGASFVRPWDASEYMELFIAIALAVFTQETVTRLVARYGPAQGPYHAMPAWR